MATKTQTPPEPARPAVPPMGQPIPLVFATTNLVAQMPSGLSVNVPGGTHWPASDPVVARYPGAFSPDVRYGLLCSEPPPGYGPDLAPLEDEEVDHGGGS